MSLNAREKAVIEAAADGAELNMTEWARTVLLEEARRVAKRVTRKTREVDAPAGRVSNKETVPFEQTGVPWDSNKAML